MKHYLLFLAVLVLVAANMTANAAQRVEFSADAVQTSPDKRTQSRRMYVGSNGIRNEGVAQGKQVIQIINLSTGVSWTLFPEQQSYLEIAIPAIAAKMIGSSINNPCDAMPGASCRQLGKEILNGRNTTKWEITGTMNGKQVRGFQWIDEQNEIPVRQYLPDGTVIEMVFKGRERIQGRNTEKWLVEVRTSQGQSTQSTQWYDPELKVTVREENAGGFVNELRNIRTGKQNPQLFTLPAGYKKISVPTPASGRR